jgi:hypothetical protein
VQRRLPRLLAALQRLLLLAMQVLLPGCCWRAVV